MENSERILRKHLLVGSALYLILAGLDVCLTLIGIDGDISMEANPIMQFMMETFGLLPGLVIEKTLVFLSVVIIGLKTGTGIKDRKKWVYYLALTPITKRWMMRKRRYFVAYVPLYLVCIGQAAAVTMWVAVFNLS